MAIYLLDANCFIQANKDMYPLDIAKSFWHKILELQEGGVIKSVDKVKQEMLRHDDELMKWINENLPHEFFFESLSQDVLSKYSEVVNWAFTKLGSPYMQQAVDKFMNDDNADAFLIAHAYIDTEQYTVVTYEKSGPMKASIIKIPDVCEAFQIKCVNMMTMFRELKETF
jgi:hypothetical protein